MGLVLFGYGASGFRRWSVIEDEVFPFIKTLSGGGAFARYMAMANFGISNPVTLQRAVTGIDELMKDYVSDIADLGDLYEYMLSKLSVSGQNGQFRTPQHIRKMMVELVDPRPGELICEIKNPYWIHINDCSLRGVAAGILGVFQGGIPLRIGRMGAARRALFAVGCTSSLHSAN